MRAAIAVFLSAAAAAAAPRFGVELFTGSAFNFPTPLSIRQQGYEEIALVARYDTSPWRVHAPYWVLRLSLADEAGAWELEHLHHKLLLSNRPREVDLFMLTHGYNIIVVNRAFTFGEVSLRAGAGVVITHPENTVRGRTLDSEQGGLGAGYYLSGAGLHAAAGRRFPLGAGFSLCVEVAFTAAWAEAAVAGGQASVPNLALHWIAGLGWSS